jgi:outer membrane protein TolC
MKSAKGLRLAFPFLMLGISIPVKAQVHESLTVEQAVRLVLESHPAIQQAIQYVAASQARIDQSRSAYYPDISGDGSYARIGPIPEITVGPGEAFKLYPENNYDFHVGLRQTVYDFGRRSTGVELAQTGQQAAGDKADLVKSNLAYQTIAVFYSILFLGQDIAVLDEQIEALNQHLLVTEKKAQAGTATDFDILTTRVRVAAATSQRVDVASMLENQKTVLHQLLGMPSEAVVELKGDFAAIPISLNADSLITIAMQRLPELRLSRNAETSAGFQRRLASLADRPTVNANIMYGFRNGYFPNLNTLKGNWIAGADLQVPLFNGHRTRGRVNEADANLSAAQAHTRDLERRAFAEIKQAIEDVTASLEKLQTSELQVRQAEDALSNARVRYDAGVITNLDLLDAQTSLSNARLVHLRALYDLVNSRYALDQATGAQPW